MSGLSGFGKLPLVARWTWRSWTCELTLALLLGSRSCGPVVEELKAIQVTGYKLFLNGESVPE